jgi:hypothetical protein
MSPSSDLESSTHTNTPTPQLRKKRIKRMKGQFIVTCSLILTLPFDMLGLHPAVASRLPRAPDPRPACAGRSPRAALAENAAPGSLLRQHFLHYFSEEIPTAERGIRTAGNTTSTHSG